MDFDEEMSSLQIEDLGEYFFPTELNNDNWKGFSLGYGEEEKPSTTTAPPPSHKHNKNNTISLSKPIAITGSKNRDRSGSLSNSLGGGGISFGNMVPDPAMLVSPPMLSSSFSDMLKHNTTAAALGFGAGGSAAVPDFTMSPAGINQFNLTATTQAPATPKTKDDELMDLANFTLEGRFHKQQHANAHTNDKKSLAMQRPPLNPAAQSSRPMLLTSNNAMATCNRIMDEDDDDEDDDDDDDDRMPMPTKRRLASSTASTPTSSTSSGSSAFGSKRPFDMVDSYPGSGACSTIGSSGGNEDDRGFRKKSREKMRRQEVNVKFDELIELLGLSNRVRKSAILQEAVGAIKSLKRERDEIRRDRDRLQQEVSKLATCLQYSHLGSVAAANAVAMSQGNPNVQFSTHHLNQASAAAQLAQLNLTQQQLSGPGCFPIGSTAGFGAAPTQSTTIAAATATTPGLATPIAPKMIKPATNLKS